MIGRTIGTYRLIKRIGIGGVGEVFMAEDPMLERQVAIKIMKPDLTGRPDLVERFRTEAVTLAKVNHTHIATVYAFLPQDPDFSLIMEYVRGWTLQQLLEVQGPLEPAIAVRFIRQALDGIGFAHRHQIIHRDIKPSNIMLSDAGIIKVMDFGLARVLGSSRVTRIDRFVGTLEYISPEQLRGEEADTRSDIYALGTVLYELVTGYLPFEHHSEYNLIRAKVEEAPPPPRMFVESLSEDLEGVILKALSTAPEDRFQSAEAFSLALDQCVTTVDDVSAFSALLFSQQQHAPVDDLSQDQRLGKQVSTPSDAALVDHRATRLAEASFFSDMQLALSTSSHKQRKYGAPVLMSGLLVGIASLFYFFAPLSFIYHPTPHPTTLESPTDILAVTVPLSSIASRSAGPLETMSEASNATPAPSHTYDTNFSIEDSPIDIALGYDAVNAQARSFFGDEWTQIDPDLSCKPPDDEPFIRLEETAEPTALALTFDMDHAFASIPELARDDAAIGLETLSGPTHNASHRKIVSTDDAITPVSDDPSFPVKPHKARKRKTDKKPEQRGSEWVIRR